MQSIKQLIRTIARKIVGYDESIKALFYYVNHLHNIADLPKAEGDLRTLQLADAKLLRIIDKICEQNDMEYWLDSGTLLGAVRHKGFIPWDDDIDLCMDRKNFQKATEILPRICNQYGIAAYEVETCRGGWIGIEYQHKNTGTWIDIISQDYSNIDITIPENKRQLEKEVKKYHTKYQKKMRTNNNIDQQAAFRKKYIPSTCRKEEAKTLVAYSEFWPDPVLYQYDDVYPLKRLDFEGVALLAPNNYDNYLKEYYGDYMQFPKGGILQHDNGKGTLDTRAKETGTDMNQIISELDNIYAKLCEKQILKN